MTKQELIAYGLTLPATYEDHPFSKNGGKWEYTVLRHLRNKKIFAIIYERPIDPLNPENEEFPEKPKLIIALKQKPELSEELRAAFTALTPAFHMNKTHWNDIQIGGDVSDENVKKMINQSYDLTNDKKKIIKRKEQ